MEQNGNFLREVRERLCKSQSEMAELLGIGRAYVSQVECGDRPMTEKLERQLRRIMEQNGIAPHGAMVGAFGISQARNAKLSINQKAEVRQMLALIESQRHTIEKQQQTIDKLIALTERLATTKE